MIDHVGINCADYPRSQEFYDSVLGALGYSRQLDFGEAIGYGCDGKPSFWIADAAAGTATGPNREVHLAFAAADENAVRGFHQAAVRLGAQSSPASGGAPSMSRGCGRNITPGTSVPSYAIPTATTSRRSGTRVRSEP